jgi:hypothetical protein
VNWEAVGAIAEFLAAIGVIVSLVFLTLQIRMNTKALRGKASFELENSWAQANRELVHDREVTAVLIKAYDASASLVDFADSDQVLIALHARDTIQRVSGQYRLHTNGLLDDGVWEAHAAWTSGWLKLPVFAEWWETEKVQSQLPSDFVRELEEHPSPVKVIRTGMNR